MRQISVSYVALVRVGHEMMRLFAGPAREERLARRCRGFAVDE